MIWVILGAWLLGLFLGYFLCWIIGSMENHKKLIDGTIEKAHDAFDGPLWIDKYPRGTRPELVQRVVDLERARHEVD